MSDVPSGVHTLRIFKTGFDLTAVTDFTVSDGATARLDVALKPLGETVSGQPPATTQLDDGEDGSNVFELTALSVTAEELRTTETVLLSVRQRAPALSDALGSETFTRLGLGDAAEIMTKITGASIVDGKYVVIRGLGDRYTSTLLNGISIPSADPDRRAVQLDQFPSEVLESVVTSKSFTPDQPGAFAGGSVNLRTKSFPDQFFASVSAGLSYNTNVMGEDVLTIPGGGRDWLGRDDGSRALPAGLPESQFPNSTAARIAARQGDFSVADELERVNEAFNNTTYLPRETSGRPGVSFAASVGDRIDLENDSRFGYVLSFNYGNRLSHFSEGSAAVLNQGSLNPDSNNFVTPFLIYSPDRSQYGFEQGIESSTAELDAAGLLDFGVTETLYMVDWGTYSQLAYSPHPDHEIALRLLFNQSASDGVVRGVGESTRSDSGRLFIKYNLLYTERTIGSAQLAGRSLLPSLNEASLDWRLAYSFSTQDQPDNRSINMFYDLRDNRVAQGNVRNFRLFRELEEDSFEGGFDFTLPLAIAFPRDAEIKFGGVLSRGERTYRGESFSYREQVLSLDQLASFPNPVGIVSRDGANLTFGNSLERANLPSPDYDAEQNISAGYLMADLGLTSSLRAIFGVRVETTELVVTPVFGEAGLIDQSDVLPAVSLVYAVGDSMNFRAAYGQTIARPTYKELSSARIEDVFLERFFAGNANLELSDIQNYDLRWEWFPRSEEIVAVSLFYKQIDRPIELVYSPSIGAITPQNLPEGIVYGIEFEFRQALGNYFDALNGFSFGMNLALMKSEVDATPEELEIIRRVFPDDDGKRELFDQPEYTFNADLSYFLVDTNTTLTLSFNVIGKALTLVNFGALPDYYRQPAPRLDFLLSQPFKGGWQIKFSATNLLDATREDSFVHNGVTYTASSYQIGRTFALSLSYVY